MNEQEIQEECSTEAEKEYRREQQKQNDEVDKKLINETTDFNELIIKRKGSGMIRQFKWAWSGKCVFCNKRVLKETICYEAGVSERELVCSLDCLEKAINNNLCNCRSYLNLEDREKFVEQIIALKKANLSK